jgi:hypothetical protein
MAKEYKITSQFILYCEEITVYVGIQFSRYEKWLCCLPGNGQFLCIVILQTKSALVRTIIINKFISIYT